MNLVAKSPSPFASGELARRARDGDEGAFRELASRMESRMAAIVRKHFGWGLTNDDLFQHALIGIYEAALAYRSEDVPFEQFAYFCALREVVSAVRSANRRKCEYLNRSRPLEAKVKEGMDLALIDLLAERLPDPQWLAELHALLELICELARDSLSDHERRCLALAVSGLSREEVARKVGRDTKSVENAIRRGRKKLAEAVEASGWDRDAQVGPSPRRATQILIEQKRLDVRAALDELGEPLSKQEIALKIGRPIQGLHQLLPRMVREGEIAEPEPGRYSAFAPGNTGEWPSHWTVVAA